MKNKGAEVNALQLSKPCMPCNNRVNHERHDGSLAFIPIGKYRIYSNKRPTSTKRPPRISAYPKGRKL